MDIWRAHLNSITWPEILRQFAIAAGLGPSRPKPKREVPYVDLICLTLLQKCAMKKISVAAPRGENISVKGCSYNLVLILAVNFGFLAWLFRHTFCEIAGQLGKNWVEDLIKRCLRSEPESLANQKYRKSTEKACRGNLRV